MKAAGEGDNHTHTKQQANKVNKKEKTSKIKNLRGKNANKSN